MAKVYTDIYQPPHKASNSTPLAKQVKSLFNKLSPSNVHPVVVELEKLFKDNSKNGTLFNDAVAALHALTIFVEDMTSILVNCIMESCLGESRAVASLSVVSIFVLTCLVDLFGNQIGMPHSLRPFVE